MPRSSPPTIHQVLVPSAFAVLSTYCCGCKSCGRRANRRIAQQRRVLACEDDLAVFGDLLGQKSRAKVQRSERLPWPPVAAWPSHPASSGSRLPRAQCQPSQRSRGCPQRFVAHKGNYSLGDSCLRTCGAFVPPCLLADSGAPTHHVRGRVGDMMPTFGPLGYLKCFLPHEAGCTCGWLFRSPGPSPGDHVGLRHTCPW